MIRPTGEEEGGGVTPNGGGEAELVACVGVAVGVAVGGDCVGGDGDGV